MYRSVGHKGAAAVTVEEQSKAVFVNVGDVPQKETPANAYEDVQRSPVAPPMPAGGPRKEQKADPTGVIPVMVVNPGLPSPRTGRLSSSAPWGIGLCSDRSHLQRACSLLGPASGWARRDRVHLRLDTKWTAQHTEGSSLMAQGSTLTIASPLRFVDLESSNA